MYKTLFIALALTFFAGCSAPQPKTPPTWYTSPPQDHTYFYAVAIADEETHARNKAIASLRESLAEQMIKAYQDPKHPLQELDNTTLIELTHGAKHLANTLSIKNVQVEESQSYHENTLVLIKVAKKDIFDTLESISVPRFHSLQSRYEMLQDKIAIQGYKDLRSLIKEYNQLANLVQLKKLALVSYQTQKEFALLRELRHLYTQYQADISIHLLSDANSIAFIQALKKSIQENDLEISKIPKSNHSLTLLMQSSTKQLMEYDFMLSKTLIEFSLYDVQKNKIASRQHTLIGKSRKSHLDAKMQSAKSLQALLKQKGLFDTLGFKE